MADDEDQEEEETSEEGAGEAAEGEPAAEADPYAEIRDLQHKIDLLHKAKEAQRDRYKKEMHLILTPLLQKHKELQRENTFLRNQLAHASSANGGEDAFLSNLKETIEEQKRELSVLKKMTQQLEEQNRSFNHDLAELHTMQEMLAEKNEFIVELEDKNREFVYQLEAKDQILARFSQQVTNLEADVYSLTRRLQENSPDIAGYEQEIQRLKREIEHLRSEKEQAHESQVTTMRHEIAQLKQDIEDYRDAMEMVLGELQDNASVYEQLSHQLLKNTADVSAN